MELWQIKILGCEMLGTTKRIRKSLHCPTHLILILLKYETVRRLSYHIMDELEIGSANLDHKTLFDGMLQPVADV